jgi:undecaprenyl-diphosphatase
MTLGQAVVYGVVQGLTEYLPVSSTAHLRIVPALLGWDDPGAAFTAVIQIGTLIAVLGYFSKDILRIVQATVQGITTGKPFETFDSRMGWMIVIGTVPVVVLGLLFKKNIETNLRSLYVIATAMIVLALVLMLAEWRVRRRARAGHKLKELSDLSWMDSIVVGLSQAVALIPGSSRSGVTITGGLFLGMTRETAARFSFLLSLPAVFAAGVYELIKQRHQLLDTQAHAIDLAVGTFVSLVVGYASIAFLLGYLKKHTTYLFIVYRLIVGFSLLWLLHVGKLQPI